MTAWLRSLVLAAELLVLAAGPVGTATDPILLIHGFGSSARIFSDLQPWLQLEGRTVVALDLPGQDNMVNAAYIKDEIAAFGWTRVDLVMHSMGGLAGRYLVKELGGAAFVQAYVSLGTPQYGLEAACHLEELTGGQMCPSGSFLSNLNRGDDTPNGPAWSTIYSRDDPIVPSASSRLDGGACRFEVIGLSHNGLVRSLGVTFPLILAALDDVADTTCPAGGAYRP
jgi:triacylglycerol lipase